MLTVARLHDGQKLRLATGLVPSGKASLESCLPASADWRPVPLSGMALQEARPGTARHIPAEVGKATKPQTCLGAPELPGQAFKTGSVQRAPPTPPPPVLSGSAREILTS